MAIARPLFLLLLFEIFVLANGTILTNKSIEITCIEDGFFPYPDDCTKYYRCVGQRRFDYICGPGTHFNARIVGCDHPESAGCQFFKTQNEPNDNTKIFSEIEMITDSSPLMAEVDKGISGQYIDCVNTCRSTYYPNFEKLREDHFQKASIMTNYHPEMAQMIVEPEYVYYRKKIIISGNDVGKWENIDTYEKFNEGNWQTQFGQPNWKQPHNADGSNLLETNNNNEEKVENDNAFSLLQPTINTKAVNISKSKILIPLINEKDNSFLVQNYTFEKYNHGIELKLLHQLEICNQFNQTFKNLCTSNAFDLLAIPNIDLEKAKPKHAIKLNSSFDLFHECHYHCTKLQNNENTDHLFKVTCLAFTYSLQSHKCLLFDQLELPFNWLNELIEGRKPKSFRSKRHTTTVIKIPQIYYLDYGKWLIGPGLQTKDFKDLVKKEKSKNYILIDHSSDNIYNCLNACSNSETCQKFAFNYIDKKCYLKINKSEQKEDSSEEDSSEEDESESKLKTIFWKMGWASGDNVQHFVQSNQGNLPIVKTNKTVKTPSSENQILDFEQTDTQNNEQSFSQTPIQSKNILNNTTRFKLVHPIIKSSKTVCLTNGHFPHPTSCNKFYHCAEKQLFIKDCSPGTHYNSLLQICDFPNNAGCTVNSDGQTQWILSSKYSGNKDEKGKKTLVTTRQYMLIPFVIHGNNSHTNTQKGVEDKSNNGRFVSEEFISEHDGIGLKLKDIPTCESTANHRLCTLYNFDWLQITDQELAIKERPIKELTIEKVKNIAKECHQACQQMIDFKKRSCIAYNFNSESRLCVLFEQITLDINWLNHLLNIDSKKVKNFHKKRHTVSRIFLPQTYIAQYQWLISPSAPKELVGKKKSDDYQVIEFANASVFECIAVCEHSPKKCVKFVFDEVNGKCFLKKEKTQKSDIDKDSSEEEDDDEEEKNKKIVYKTGWLSGRNLKELINQGHVLKQFNQNNSLNNNFDSQLENRAKQYFEIFRPIVNESQNVFKNNSNFKKFDQTKTVNANTSQLDDQVIAITTNAHQNADINFNKKLNKNVSSHLTNKTELEKLTAVSSEFQLDFHKEDNKIKPINSFLKYLFTRGYSITDPNLDKLVKKVIQFSVKTTLIEPVAVAQLTTNDLAVIQENQFTVDKNTGEPTPPLAEDAEYMSQFQRCDSNSNESLCTLNNFEWLQLADTEIHKPTDKGPSSLPTIEFSLKTPDDLEQCQKRCMMMSPEEPELEFATNGCAAFTYDIETGKCILFMEIELETFWLKTLKTDVNKMNQLPQTMRSKRNSVSRVNVPPVFIIGEQWITSYQVFPVETLTELYKIIEIPGTNKTFFGCLNACSQLKGCHKVVYSSVEKICYVLKNDDDAAEKESSSEKYFKKFLLKSSWISAKYLFSNKAIEQKLNEEGIKPLKKQKYENSENINQQTSTTFPTNIIRLYPYLVFKKLPNSHVPTTTTNYFETVDNISSESTASDYLHRIPSCTSNFQTLCNLNNFELIQIKDKQINKENMPTKEIILNKGTNLPESCHNYCLEHYSDLNESKTNISKKETHTCVAYSYEENTGKCLLYSKLSFESDWIEMLKFSYSNKIPNGFLSKRDTTTRIFVPQFEQHKFILNSNGIWLIGPQLPFEYMTNIGSSSGQTPLVQFTPSLEECAASCQHESKQFVYNTDRQMCYYINSYKEGDLSKKVFLQTGWISGLYVTEELPEKLTISNENCSEDGYFPHENSCDKFYRCSGGRRFDFDCGPGTHFNPSINNCDWPDKAGCKSANNAKEVISQNHNHSEPKLTIEETRNNQVTLPKGGWPTFQNHGVNNIKKQIALTKVDNKTKTISLPYVVDPNETFEPKPTEETENFVDGTYNLQSNSTISSLPICSSLSTAKPLGQQPCKTGSNFDWLQLSDTTLADNLTETHKKIKLKSNDSDVIAVACHKLCQKLFLISEQHSTSFSSTSSSFISCVAYTFEISSGTCLLYSQLELPSNWVQMIVETTTIPTTTNIQHIFKSSPGFQTRLNVPKSQLIDRQWLITPAIPTGISFNVNTATDNSTFPYERVEAKTTNFFDCLIVCEKVPKCISFVYSALDHKCFVNAKSANSSLFETTIVYQSGWVSATNLHALTYKNISNVFQFLSGTNQFYIETNSIILDLIEQYLLKKDYKSIVPQSDRKFLNPLKTITSVTSLDECQSQCTQSWFDKNSKEDHSVQQSEDEEFIILENETLIEPRKRRFVNIKKTEKHLKKHKCKFITVQENFQTLGKNKTYTCQLFSEETIEVLIKLLSKKTQPNKNILAKVTSKTVNFVKDKVGSVTNLFNNSFGKKNRRSVNDNNSYENQQVNIFPVSAYVFYNNPTVRFYKVEEPETIKQAEINQKSYLNWTGITNDQKCFKSCLSSWNKLTNHQNNICRFLVVKAVVADTITYNCTFYKTDPSHPIADIEVLQYEIHSYPYEMPVSFSHSASYFNQITKSDKQMQLQTVETLSNVEEVNFCLHHCLKQWLKPKQPFDFETTKCRHVSVVKNSNVDNRYAKYNCTFSDVFENNNIADDSSLLQSLGNSGNVAFQLRQLPTTEAFKNPALNYIEYFTPIPVETKTIDNMFGSIKPLYLLDYLQNYAECLKVCVDLWARIKLGDSRPDRCRLVLVKKSLEKDQFKQIITRKPLFQCAIYDVDIEKKFDETDDKALSGNQFKFTRIYRKKPNISLLAKNDSFQAEDYEAIPSSLVAGVISVLVNTQTPSFYHFTRILSAQQCLSHCLDVKSTGHSEPCQLAVAKAVFGKDLQTGRQQLTYECSFYDYTLNFNLTEKLSVLKSKVPSIESYQMMAQLSSEDSPQFKLVDNNFEPVRYAMDSYEPVLTIDGLSSKDECLNECKLFKKKNKLHAFFKSIDCQMTVISPRVIRNKTIIDYTCRLYNFNITSYRLADLDQPEPLRGFELNWNEFTFTDLFNANFKQSKTVNKFSPLSSLKPLHSNGARSKRAFYHAEVNEPTECFSLCLNTWAVGFLLNQQRQLCRFVIMREKYKTDVLIKNIKYDCALYSHNLTTSLQSLHILLQPPLAPADAPKSIFVSDNHLVTSSGTLYRTLPWLIPPPYQTDSTELITNSVNVKSCLAYCDAKLTCIAVQTMFDVKGNLSKCFLISRDEYYPDNGLFPKGNETSFIQIKITNIDNSLLQLQIDLNHKHLKSFSTNSYLNIINAAHRYELNEPLAYKLNGN